MIWRSLIVAVLATAIIAALALSAHAMGRDGDERGRVAPTMVPQRHAARHVSLPAENVKNTNLSALVASINDKLRRYVHPTGRCGGASEQLATYYWDGQRVASGGRFNPHGLTAASRHLPFGTTLYVTNPHNGRAVTVVVNDRGPYTIADIDLSLGAAQSLGMTQSSYVCVR